MIHILQHLREVTDRAVRITIPEKVGHSTACTRFASRHNFVKALEEPFVSMFGRGLPGYTSTYARSVRGDFDILVFLRNASVSEVEWVAGQFPEEISMVLLASLMQTPTAPSQAPPVSSPT